MKKLICVVLVLSMLLITSAYAYDELPAYKLLRQTGDVMSDTIKDGDTVICLITSDVQRNEIVAYVSNVGSVINRVVAIPGDQVYRKNAVTHVVYEEIDNEGNVRSVDESLDERYALLFPAGSSDDYEVYTLGEDEYFLVGDNRYNSHDSRDWKDGDPARDIGPVQKEAIIGIVIGIIKQ